MNEHNNQSDSHHRSHQDCRLGRSARLWVAALALLALGAGAGAVLAVSSGAAAHGMRAWQHHARIDDIDQARERAGEALAWVLGRVDATPGQESQAQAVVMALAERLYPLAEEHRTNRRLLLETLTQPQVDRAALEAIRQAELALADAASAGLADALAELAAILTPEQRRELAGVARRHRD